MAHWSRSPVSVTFPNSAETGAAQTDSADLSSYILSDVPPTPTNRTRSEPMTEPMTQPDPGSKAARPAGRTQTGSPAPAENLRRRAQLAAAARAFFDQREFVEIQVPVWGAEVIVDLHLDPVACPLRLPGHPQPVQGYLQTSPELALKRLLSLELPRIYSLGPAFRDGEAGQWHNPEFTLLEWYRCGDDLQAGVTLLGELVCELLAAPGIEQFRWTELFERYAGLNPWDCKPEQLGQRAVELGLVTSPDWTDDWDGWTELIFSQHIEPRIGRARPTVVTHYPATQAALARPDADDSRLAERFELFYGGLELANGYHELLDAEELERRQRLVTEQRRAAGKPELPTPTRLATAMRESMPPSAGCALGFDRLVMLACQAESLADVLPFTVQGA
jgi:elongation factor P--(R)-beta-lysine ligase